LALNQLALNQLSTGTGLLVAAAAPVAVIGWAILFSVEAARRGPAWSFRHLGIVSNVLKPSLAIGIVAVLVVRPIWVGLGIAYPLAVGLLMVASRRRQLAVIDRESGFGQVRPEIRDVLLSRLRVGLSIVGVSSLVVALLLASVGVPQGWLVGALAPIAAIALLRSKQGQVGSALPPSL
jgi:hypothetical protein